MAAAYPPVKGSDFWKRKIKTLFTRLDANHDGVLTSDDFKQMAGAFISISKLTGKEADRINTAMDQIWKEFCMPASDSEQTDHAKFEANYLKNANGTLRPAIEKLGLDVFSAIDVNGDAKISRTEFENFNTCWGVCPQETKVIFDVLDTDGDGNIAKEEYMIGMIDFFFSEVTSSAFKVLFGSLVD